MTRTLELLQELTNLIRLETNDGSIDSEVFQNDNELLNWDQILQQLIDLMKHDYLSRKNMMIQLKAKELNIKELNIEVANLKKSLKEFGHLKYHLHKQLELNDKLQQQVEQYRNEFRELESEIKGIRGSMPDKNIRR
ncbi:uncharacterized protein KLLA0_D09218g [Kluyveromyces lactis]|uniref:KLLA0D09218p n=1 Tax=Kluyveromyces lactis (strain ATCC 8585 / CBS 2359 / DSM 70799 / NBRC 1267 / NRRL Y-1140 / WM37) TaxID=284590 RepID=Q6CRG6_KLULA|nr:uncharacterized protein KLLA0_D09218g [Kluyveromyces lactis]CAH00569.1 KLLA0D09218p [Kluyveromyces lactis]|eukprot:XP_453473.1 uncharacterized protein KLLA0_D09218g [Kluyveromyces lactis]